MQEVLKLNEDVTRKGGVVGEILVIDAYDQLEIIGDFEPLNTSEHLKRQCEEGVRFQVHIFPLACKEGKKKRKDICALTPIGNTPKLSRTTEMHVSLFLVNM